MKWFFQGIIIIFLSVLGGILGNYLIQSSILQSYSQRTNLNIPLKPSGTIKENKIIIQENTALKNAIKEAEKKVVLIRGVSADGKITDGMGIFLSVDGLIITLKELTPKNGKIFVRTLEDKVYEAQALKKDEKNNLALLKIEGSEFSPAAFFDFEKLSLGERVFSLETFLVKTEIKKIVREGIVNSFEKDKIITSINEKNIISGAPIFDIEGNLIGLTSLKKNGETFLVPVTTIKIFTGF